MVCTPTNVYPNGQCVDGDKLFKMSSIYYGDNCLYAQTNFFDYDTMNLYAQHRGFEGRDGIHNGDDLSTVSPRKFAQNKEYLWNYRFFEKVDPDNGYYPTTLKMRGLLLDNPVKVATVGSMYPDSIITPTEIPLSDCPVGWDWIYSNNTCYYVYWEGHGRRVITSKKKSTNSIVIDEAFAGSPPPIGTKLYISRIKTDNLQKLIEESEVNNTDENAKRPIFISDGLNIDCIVHVTTVQGVTYNIYESYFKKMYDSTVYYPIKKYYPLTGKIEFAVDIQEEFWDLMHYQIYTTFVDSPYYYFRTKATPVITPTVALNKNMFLYYDASIARDGDYSIDYYYWQIYCNGKLVKQSREIYNERLNYIFREVKGGETYTAKVTLKTKDGMTSTSEEISFTVPLGTENRCNNFKAKTIDSLNAMKLTWDNSGATFSHNIYRKNLATNKIEYLATLYTNKNGAGRITEFYDYTCENRSEYKYIMRPTVDGKILEEIESNSILTDFSDWSIYFLNEFPYTYLSFYEEEDTHTFRNTNLLTMQSDKRYTISSIWKMQINPKIDSVEHNIGRDAKETYYHKPVVTYGETRYDSFPLEFTIGEFSCTTESLEGVDVPTFKRWLAEIDSKKPVLIKDNKGFMWFGHITKHSYSTDYTVDDGMITVQLEFVQTADNENVRILKNELGTR